MRLTLRTLLAYLDDTLDPAQTKLIGQKIAESPAAQELITRLKEVVRRRRLTTPPATGPGAKLDANTIAEYIDSVLPSEQLAEVEETALASDIYLAEIAACHQILSVVLSEPSPVPPTARERMYGLIQGKEAIRRRKPAPTPGAHAEDSAVVDHRDETDETLLLGLPLYRLRGARLNRFLPLAGVGLLAALLVAALYMAFPGNERRPRRNLEPSQVAQNEQPKGDERIKEPAAPAEKTGDRKPEDKKPEGAKPEDKKPEDTKPQDKKPEDKKPEDKKPEGTTPKPTDPVVPPVRPDSQPPRTERRSVGQYIVSKGSTSILLAQERGTDTWRRLPHDAVVQSTDPLLSLPGSSSQVQLNSGVMLRLWGDLVTAIPAVLESAVILYDNPDVDVNLTLQRGRIALTNTKANGAAKIKIRFNQEIWDLSLLTRDTEVVLVGGGFFLAGVGFNPNAGAEGPSALLLVCVARGEATLKVRYETHSLRAPPGPALVMWDNVGPVPGGPQALDKVPPWAADAPPPPVKMIQEMLKAEEALAKHMKPGVSADVPLAETLASKDPYTRIYGILCLGAIQELPRVVSALEDTKNGEVRQAAIDTLRAFIAEDSSNDRKAYQILEKKYDKSAAEIIMQLLHPLHKDSFHNPDTFVTLIAYLRHQRLPIRELARWWLYAKVPEGSKIPYDPAGPAEQRDAAVKAWHQVVPEGKLPPQPKK